MSRARCARKIRKASQRLDYVRERRGRHRCARCARRTVGVIVPDITDPVYPPIIRGIEDGLARHGYVAILANTDGDPRRQQRIIETHAAARHRRADRRHRARATRTSRGSLRACRS